MLTCWNCRRPTAEDNKGCAYCGASFPASRKHRGKRMKQGPPSELPPEPEPPLLLPLTVPPEPVPASAGPSVRRAPRAGRERTEYVLHDADDVRDRDSDRDTAGEPASSPPPPLPEQAPPAGVTGLGLAMRRNAKAAAFLVACVCVVTLIGGAVTGVEPPPRIEPPTAKDAEAKGLFYGAATPSAPVVTWHGQGFAIEEAWVARIGRTEAEKEKRLLESLEDRLRLYVRVIPTGTEPFELCSGYNEAHARALAAQPGERGTVYYVDLFARVNPPQRFTIRDPDHPEYGAATFSVAMQ